jgi:integrase
MADLRNGRPVSIMTRKARANTFGDALAAYLEIKTKIPKPTRSLAAKYIPAKFKAKPVTALTAEDVRDVLTGKDDKGEPIWTGTGPNRGNRLRLLMCSVFASKGVHPNPALWEKGAPLPELMPDTDKHVVKHHDAMPFAEVPAFMATLGDSIEDRAGRFVILTGVRRKEALAAKWGEFDHKARLWTIPAARMKVKDNGDHKVPLSDAAIAALGKPGADAAYVFTNQAGGPLDDSHAALDKTWVPSGYTLHGFRTSFATWAEEQDSGRRFPARVIDAALAHAKKDAKGERNEVTAAYQRSKLFEARRELMDAWANYATRPPNPNLKKAA